MKHKCDSWMRKHVKVNEYHFKCYLDPSEWTTSECYVECIKEYDVKSGKPTNLMTLVKLFCDWLKVDSAEKYLELPRRLKNTKYIITSMFGFILNVCAIFDTIYGTSKVRMVPQSGDKNSERVWKQFRSHKKSKHNWNASLWIIISHDSKSIFCK